MAKTVWTTILQAWGDATPGPVFPSKEGAISWCESNNAVNRDKYDVWEEVDVDPIPPAKKEF